MKVEENGWPTLPPARSYARQEEALRLMLGAVHDFRGTYNVTDYRWFNLRDSDTSSPMLFQHWAARGRLRPQTRVRGVPLARRRTGALAGPPACPSRACGFLPLPQAADSPGSRGRPAPRAAGRLLPRPPRGARHPAAAQPDHRPPPPSRRPHRHRARARVRIGRRPLDPLSRRYRTCASRSGRG